MLMRVIVTWSSHLAANPGDGSGGKQVVSSSAKMRLHFIAHWEMTLLGEFLNIGWQHLLKTGTEKKQVIYGDKNVNMKQTRRNRDNMTILNTMEQNWSAMRFLHKLGYKKEGFLNMMHCIIIGDIFPEVSPQLICKMVNMLNTVTRKTNGLDVIQLNHYFTQKWISASHNMTPKSFTGREDKRTT